MNRVVCTCGWIAPARPDGPGPLWELIDHRVEDFRHRTYADAMWAQHISRQTGCSLVRGDDKSLSLYDGWPNVVRITAEAL